MYNLYYTVSKSHTQKILRQSFLYQAFPVRLQWNDTLQILSSWVVQQRKFCMCAVKALRKPFLCPKGSLKHCLSIPEAFRERIYSNMHTFVCRPGLSRFPWHVTPGDFTPILRPFCSLKSNFIFKSSMLCCFYCSSKFCRQPNSFFSNSHISTHILS